MSYSGPPPDEHQGRTELTERKSQQPPVAVVIDSLQLRRCCFTQALSDWLAGQDISVQSMSPSALRSDAPLNVPCDLIILNIGALPILEVAKRGTLRRIRECFGSKPVLILSDRDNAEEAREAFRHGAQGYITSDMKRDVALSAFMFILHGGTYFPPSALLATDGTGAACVENAAPAALPEPAAAAGLGEDTPNTDVERVIGSFTARQNDVLPLLQEGLPNKVIALQLGMTEATVKVHVRQIMRKLGARNRTQAVVRLSSARPNTSESVSTYRPPEKITLYRSQA